MVDSIIDSVNLDNLMEKPSVFTISEDLLIRKYRTMLYDDKRTLKKKLERQTAGLITFNQQKRPSRILIEDSIDKLKVKYAVLKGLITVEQALKYGYVEEQERV